MVMDTMVLSHPTHTTHQHTNTSRRVSKSQSSFCIYMQSDFRHKIRLVFLLSIERFHFFNISDEIFGLKNEIGAFILLIICLV